MGLSLGPAIRPDHSPGPRRTCGRSCSHSCRRAAAGPMPVRPGTSGATALAESAFPPKQ